MNKGDRVKLSPEGLKAVYANSKEWADRRGAVAHQPQTADGNVGVIWDGRKSLERYAREFLELVKEG